MAFLDRLYTAKRKVENRIIALGGHEDSVSSLDLSSDMFLAETDKMNEAPILTRR